MQTDYQRELDFTLSVLARLRIPARVMHSGVTPAVQADSTGGTPDALADDHYVWQMVQHRLRKRTVCKVLDQYMRQYICFQLPDTDPPAAVVLGPYLTSDIGPDDILEIAEARGIPLSLLPQLSDYYASLPVHHDPSVILSVVSSLGEVLWCGQEFDMVDVEDEQHIRLPSDVSTAAPIEQENILQRMQQMEERYAYENELMEIVSKGLTSRAEGIMSSVSRLNYQPRVPDPLRNMKNYCIICNTLLRKAAQQGGVHPLHLHEMSGRFAHMIENAPTQDKCGTLIGEMIRAYCRLVRTHADRQHSATVQKVLTYISANLSGNLSLTALARLMQLTPSYLSTLFHRETGTTLAEHIIDSRMRAARRLLKDTRLQIQSIAQLCGYSDPNYFSRQFRQHCSMTPLQYRKEQTGGTGQRSE